MLVEGKAFFNKPFTQISLWINIYSMAMILEYSLTLGQC